MSSVMAIVSKAVFEKEARGKGVGDVWATDRYASHHKQLAAVEHGGDLYLVTVRPPEVLCLVAVLRAPARGTGGYRAKPNVVPIRELGGVRSRLRFQSGTPLPTKSGTLGMSLQTPRVLSDGDVKLLEGLAVGSSSKPARRAKSSKPAKSKPRDGVASSVVAGSPGAGMAGLLALWATEPSAALAKQIMMLSEATAVELAEIAGKSAEAHAAWARHAKRSDPSMVPALLSTLADATSGNAALRLQLVAKWPADPRVDAAIAGWLEAPPYHALMTKPFWEAVFKLARRIREPGQLARLAAADAKIARSVAATMGAWLRGQLGKLLDELRPIVAELPASTGAVDALARDLAALDVGRSDLPQLLAAVHADPTSDAARMVYADALTERGDPRGEFIVIQCRLAEAPDDRALRARETALLAAHGKKWLGGLAHLVKADHRFERGFLAACEIKAGKWDAALETAADPIWCTVHTYEGPFELVYAPTMKSLRTVTYHGDTPDDEGAPADWHKLLVGGEWPFEHVHYRLGDDRTAQAVAALGTCPALPKLRTLAVDNDEHELACLKPLFAAPVLARLDELTVAVSWRGGYLERMKDPMGWASALGPALGGARVPRLTVQLNYDYEPPVRITFERSGRAYATASIEIRPAGRGDGAATVVEEVIAVLRMARAVRRATINRRHGLGASAHAALERALSELPLESHAFA